ncbi:hypothetical protein EV363DRAFT_1358258 [Boletus edulis]|uniref:Transmembrane protein n=1 Tax=Boletus edulis BED1 TaxID=1328754 RepID=A0AAD4BYE5_BOLED|nr:hypothetical protein EV363DRAFT_1358258 [Boletus edulis]KAF8443680.1 hypothetical protein L210DRAFT_953094 [Boletus edulis BED1]
MRVLSFIPAFLLATASFVASAPTNPVDTSCVSAPGGGSGSGNDAALQPVISIIANATTQIQPLSGQLTALKGDSCTPEAVADIVVQITAVVSFCVTQIQATAKVDFTGLDFGRLCVAIYANLTVMLTVLNTLVMIVGFLGAKAVGTVDVVVCNLLNAVIKFVGCLDGFVVVSVTGILGPAIALVNASVQFLLPIVVGLKASVGVN